MLQRAVALLLQRLLGKFVSFDSSMLRLSLWQGDVSFQNLELRLSYGKGSIGHLSVKIPWRSLWTQPVVIKAQGIHILLHQTPKTANPVLDGLELGLDGDDALTDTIDTGDAGDDRTYLSRLVSHIIANVQVELTDVQIRYECTEKSIAKRPGSATLEIGFVSLVNTNADWELEFTPQSNTNMESRKLVTIERVSAYIEYHDATSADPEGTSQIRQEYLLHDWYSVMKVGLYYQSAHSSFPDVEIDLDIGCRPTSQSGTCKICHGNGILDDSIKAHRPRVHFGPEHLDVLYSILMEVKAPYDEYDRFAAMTQQQSSRPEGFVMVLAYAKQWLLSDCIDAVVGEALVLAGDSDDDDDDEFEDAITPPSLCIRTALIDGLHLRFFSRDRDDSISRSSDRYTWDWILGETRASMKQSCVEDEIQLMVRSLTMLEQRGSKTMYSIFDSSSNCDDLPLVEISCVIPAYQSRLVGHQPSMSFQLRHKCVLSLKDETLVMWMTLFTPVYVWWNEWNLFHPSKLITREEARIAPVSKLSISLDSFRLIFSAHNQASFGVEITGLLVKTSETQTMVTTKFDLARFRLLSSMNDIVSLHSSMDANKSVDIHEIMLLEDICLALRSHSRTKWSPDEYVCKHLVTDEDEDQAKSTHISESETAMYNYDLILPVVRSNWEAHEIEILSWIIGKWVFFLPDTDPAGKDRNLYVRDGKHLPRNLCTSKWTISVPELQISFGDESRSTSRILLSIKDLNFSRSDCTMMYTQRLTAFSISLQENAHSLLYSTGNPRLSNPALSLWYHEEWLYAGTVAETIHGSNEIRLVLPYIGQTTKMNVRLERITGALSLQNMERVSNIMVSCCDNYHLGFILSTSYGYDFDAFRQNLAKLQSHQSMVKRSKALRNGDKYIFSVTVAQACQISILHYDKASVDEKAAPAKDPVEIGLLECDSISVQTCFDSASNFEVKGAIRNLQIVDLTHPKNFPDGYSDLSNRHFIGSNQHMMTSRTDIGSFGLKNVVDFVISQNGKREHYADGDEREMKLTPILVQVRLDSVCVVHLHRVMKQFQHYVLDHVIPVFINRFDHNPSHQKAETVLQLFAVDMSQLPVCLEEILSEYRSLVGDLSNDFSSSNVQKKPLIQYELVANDLTYILPRSSFSTDSIILHSTNARLWSAGIEPGDSNFLQNGNFGEEERLSHSSAISGATAAKAQQIRRTELRNLRRLVMNQRSRILSNRSQLFIDLKSATQQAQNYLHEGFEALPAAEEAVKIIHNKLLTLDKQLELLAEYLKDVDNAIEIAKAEGELLNQSGRDSMIFIPNGAATTSNSQSYSLDKIRKAVTSMSQHLVASLFAADDAEFHDARAASETTMLLPLSSGEDMSTSSMGLFEFELVDLSGMTSNSSAPLFHHALLMGRLDWEPESLSETSLNSFLGINLSLNELSVGASADQYKLLLGIIFENFQEKSFTVDEDVYPLCRMCQGHHYEHEFCNAIWMRIPIKVADAALRVSSADHSIADIFFEQFELVFVLRTDDSLEICASALSFSATDVRPARCTTASEMFRPLPGDGHQIEYRQKANWTDSSYSLKLNNTNCLVVYPAISELVEFFVHPILAEEYFDFNVGFMPPPSPDWKRMELHVLSSGCLFSLLEDFRKIDSRALVLLTNISIGYSSSQKCEDTLDLKKCHFVFDQRGIYFSQLPDLQIDASFPLSNSFQLVFDHLVEGSASLTRRNSFVLAPVETRFSVQDANLFMDIVNNYLEWSPAPVDTRYSKKNDTPSLTKEGAAKHITTYTVDKLLGDVGEVRLVLVNNSLGIPIADFQLSEIVCEYIKDEDFSTVLGGILAFNYFNNSIYRWEPLVEPFVAQVRIHRTLDQSSRVEVFANLPNTVNVNITPAMAPLLSSEALKQADFVTSGSKSTSPFWIQNKTGMDLKFSFRRGKGNVIQQLVTDESRVSVDCREQGDMRSFDSASTDRFLRQSDQNALTANHTLSVWLNDNKWVSANPVVVDVVGHVSVPLREVMSPNVVEIDLEDEIDIAEDLSPPILVAEISIQADGSKLITLHSQIVLQNRASVPLMVWAFSPRDGGCVKEWIIDREQVCYVPLQLIHPQSKISIRPSPTVQYAPLATSLEELGDEVRVVKTCNTKRFIRSGSCDCNFEKFVSIDELQSVPAVSALNPSSSSTAPLTGYVVRDLPAWKCTYDVEAYYLMRATFSCIEEPTTPSANADNLPQIEEEENAKVEDEFMNVFSDGNQRRRINHPLREVNYELDEARAANQRRGLYEATNSSLYHLSVSPFFTVHNRLATPVAYRLLNGSLQLIAEGILAVGNVLPLFQVDPAALLYVSFRLENYNWSSPKMIINPKNPAYTLPYKDTIEPVKLHGRVFDRDIPMEQSNVPNLQLQVKLSGRDVIVFCSVWIVNHSDLDLEYCCTGSSSSKRLESIFKYVHRRPSSEAEQTAIFSSRTLSFHGEATREVALTRLQKMKASTNPVALIVVVKEGKDLYNSQYFGSQSPYVTASLYVLKNPQDRNLEKPEMRVICSATTKPAPSGGLNPKWDGKLHNTLLLRFPEEVQSLEMARVIIEVRNVRYGIDTCLGVAAVKLESILKDPKNATAFNWYKLLKRKSSRERKNARSNQTHAHRGDICVSFSIGSTQELRSELDDATDVDRNGNGHRSPSFYDDARPSLLSPADSEIISPMDIDAASIVGSHESESLPISGIARSMQRFNAPAPLHPATIAGMNGDITATSAPRTSRQKYAFSDLDSTRSYQDALSVDPVSVRAHQKGINGLDDASPLKLLPNEKVYPIQVYLPQNRFAFVVVEVPASYLLSDVFDLVCMTCGFQGVLDPEDFDFYELVLPRFVSLRSAGRPEGDRWYGRRISMDSRIGKAGRHHGLHLCHNMTMTTIRLYDETSTASAHHATPRSLLTSSKRTNPAQNRPMAWGEVLLYGGGGKNWDVLRMKSHTSPWSEVIRLNRNAMGNSGVAQVITLTNEVYDREQASELRKGSQELALWSCYGTGRYSDTIVATIVPRYILINRTQETIKYRQLNAPQTFHLAANDVVPFHWPSSSKEKLLEVTLLHKYTWSGSFRINSIGTTYLKLRDTNNPSQIYIMQCQVEMIGGSIVLAFREESRRFPPYRIDNMTSFRIQYKQTNWGGSKDFDELLPRSSCAYSWDHLHSNEKASTSQVSAEQTFAGGGSSSSSRALQVRFMRVTSSTTGTDSEKDAVEIREYNLDHMMSHKRIQLHRSLPSQLFLKPDHKGYLLKKDNLLKWAKKYFRLYEHMLYYFASETDQELLGVVDLRSNSEIPGAGGVAIFEKTAEAPSKGGFISLNGFVSSISGSIFGSSSKQLRGGNDDDDDDGARASELVQLAVLMTSSGTLCEASERFVDDMVENDEAEKVRVSQKGFYVNGDALVDFLITEQHASAKNQAFTTAQEMLQLGVLRALQLTQGSGQARKSPMDLSFQCSKNVWYTVESINLSDDRDSLDSEDDASQMSQLSTRSCSSKMNMKVTGSTQFSIITTTKCYDLKAKSPQAAKAWVRRLRAAVRDGQRKNDQEPSDDGDLSAESGNVKAQRTASKDSISIVQNAKTYVHTRIRADGPTKVLEIYEGGEEDFVDKENKYDLSSANSVSSSSPTASEASTNNAIDALTNGISLHLRVDGFGISCVNEIPMELIYIYLGGINVRYSRVNTKMRLNATLDDVQVDNQSVEATFSKLLCPRVHKEASTPTERKRSISDLEEDIAAMTGRSYLDPESSLDTTGLVVNENLFSCADCKYRQPNIAAVHFCCTWSNEQGTTDYFEHFSFWLHPVITQLDEEFLVSARAFLTAMTQSWGQHKTQKRGGEIRMKSIPSETMTESLSEYKEQTCSADLDPLKSLHLSMTSSSTEVRKVYFALLHLHPIEFDITFRSDVFQTKTTMLLRESSSRHHSRHIGEDLRRTSSTPSSSRHLLDIDRDGSDDAQTSAVTWAIPSLTTHIPDLDNAPVRLNALMIEHAFGTGGDLSRRVSKYYTRQLWKQLHKVLGSFDFLGNPVGFLDHIGTGVRDFVYEPLEGLKVGGKGFSKGLAKGTASLVSNTIDGTFDAASKISGTFGQGLANLSLDDHYQQVRARARRHHVRSIRDGLVQGSKEFSLGVYEGVTGLVMGPMRGAQENGALGFVKGTVTGIIGLPVKPVAGIFDFASRATQGVRNRSFHNSHDMRRVRRPRVFGRYNELKCYKEADTIAFDLLKKTGGAKLADEKIIFYNEIMQSVSASELTQEARDRRRKNDTSRERTNSLRRSLQEQGETTPPLELGARKLVYEVVFHQKKLGLDLETDFYCENVTVKAFDESHRHQISVPTKLEPDQKILQDGDCLLAIGGIDVRDIGFNETLALIRGTSRPLTIQFESCNEHVYTDKRDGQTSKMTAPLTPVNGDEQNAKLKVQLTHWLIVTEQRALYINVGSFANPVVEWMTPLRYIYRVEWLKGSKICLNLSVGVDSLPTGPRLRPSLKALDNQERDMNVFLDLMWHSFGTATAEEQELWPSDTSLNGYLLKKGGFTTVKRWFVLSRNCLYYFSSQKELRGIIPLGNVRLETDASAGLSIRITNAVRNQPLVSLQMDGGQVVERVQSEVLLLAPTAQEFEMWQSSLAHAAGKGMRHSRGTRFFVPTAASILEIGCKDTPDFVVAPLAGALTKTVEVFNTKLPGA